MIQAIVFDKSTWNANDARKFLKRHKLSPIKRVHITDQYLRYRINEPIHGARYRMIDFGDGIKAIMKY